MFQLGGISGTRTSPQEKLVLVHFHKLSQLFPTLRNHATLVAVPGKFARLAQLLEKALNLAATSKIIGSIEKSFPGSTVLVRKKGVLPLALFRGGWCQSEKTIDTLLLDKLYRESVSASTEFLTQRVVSEFGRVCFVHVRRGDYLSFPSPEHSAALPPSWYREQISRIAEENPGIRFQFFSDELDFVREEFRDVAKSEFVDADNYDSFLLMAASDHGILSASTYSWWAAYFAHNRSHGTFVAPHFWWGWRLKQWLPDEEIRTSFLQYERVN